MTENENNNEFYSGKIAITNLQDEFIKAYKIIDGVIVSELLKKGNRNKQSFYQKSSKSSDDCDEDADKRDVFCNNSLEEVVIIVPRPRSINYPLDYLFVFKGYGNVPSTGFDWNFSGSGNLSNNLIFNEDEMIFDEGDKPLEEFDNKCNGINRIWSLSQASGDEFAAVLTSDGAILITQQLNPNGGGISGIYNFNGNTYYQYPASQGSPARTYAGQLYASGRYFIPISATLHSHTPCINDGTDGIKNNIINDDKAFASHYPKVNHYIIGCNAIGQFNGSSNQPFNINNGNLNNNCNKIN